MHRFFAPAEPALEQPDRPSQMVQERTVSTPRGQHVQVTLERVSTGGTRHQAQFERASTGPMSGAERMKKQRARCSLFPETQASAREKDAERVAARRTAAGERMDVDEEAEPAAWSTTELTEHTLQMRRVTEIWREHPQLEVSQLDVAAEHALIMALILEEQVAKWKCTQHGTQISKKPPNPLWLGKSGKKDKRGRRTRGIRQEKGKTARWRRRMGERERSAEGER